MKNFTTLLKLKARKRNQITRTFIACNFSLCKKWRQKNFHFSPWLSPLLLYTQLMMTQLKISRNETSRPKKFVKRSFFFISLLRTFELYRRGNSKTFFSLFFSFFFNFKTSDPRWKTSQTFKILKLKLQQNYSGPALHSRGNL